MHLMTPIILDAIVIFILIFSVIFSYRKGFLRSILSIASYVVSFFIANFIGKFISQLIFDNLLASSIQESISNTLYSSLSAGNLSNGLSELSNIVPDFLTSYLLGGKTVDDVAGVFIAQQNIYSAANAITTQIVRPSVILVMSLLLFFVLFILCKILFHYLYKLTGVLNKVPIIGMLNGLLGGLCGIVKAGIIIFIIAIISWVLILITKDQLNFLNTNIISDTHLFFVFYKINPFAI